MDSKTYYLGMYEKALPENMTWKEKLNACKETGFDWIEISIDESDEKISRLYWSKQEKQLLKDAINETGVPIWTMCFSAQRKYSLGSIDLEKRTKAMELMELAIDFASEIGIRIIQLAGYDTYYEKSCKQSKEIFSENLKKACEMASRKGICMGFETMMDRDFLDTVEKGMHYVNLCNSPYLGMYPDIGNLEAARMKNSYFNSVSSDIGSNY